MSKVSWLSRNAKPDVLVTNEAASPAPRQDHPRERHTPFPPRLCPHVENFNGTGRREEGGLGDQTRAGDPDGEDPKPGSEEKVLPQEAWRLLLCRAGQCQ